VKGLSIARVVHKSTVRSVVKKTVCNERIIPLKLKADPVFWVQIYMPTLGAEYDEVEELYDICEESFEEDGNGERSIIIMEDWNSVVGDNHTVTLLDHID
jgi:hypothetical protein